MAFLDVFGIVAFLVVVYGVVQLFRMLRADCDLTLLSKEMKPSYFVGKCIWIIGASGGIGEQLSVLLSSIGAKIVLSGLPGEVEKMREIAQSVLRPQNVRILPLDLLICESLPSKAEEATKMFGHIDIVILAAGIAQFGHFKDVQPEVDRRVMEVDYFGQRTLIQEVLPGMLERGAGHIVGISSFSGKVGSPFCSSYSAAKFALLGLLESLRFELFNSQISVTSICPGPVQTPLFKKGIHVDGKMIGDKVGSKELVQTVMNKAMRPERCAELILTAVSNQLDEVWLGRWPFLQYIYLRQYFPSLCTFLAKRETLSEKFADQLKALH